MDKTKVSDYSEGIITDVIVEEKSTPRSLIKLIAKKQKLEEAFVASQLRHNVLTFQQLSELSGKSVGYIHQQTNGLQVKDGIRSYGLNCCFPFPQKKGKLKMVFRNPKCEVWLEKVNRNGAKKRTSK